MTKYRIDEETGALIFAPVSSFNEEDLIEKINQLEETIKELTARVDLLEKKVNKWLTMRNNLFQYL